MPAALRLYPLFIRRTLGRNVHGHQSGAMTRKNGHTAHALGCDSCGQLPHPEKVGLTLATIAAMLPIELVVHTTLPYLLKVLVLTLTATVLVIWVAEPSVRIALQGWLHAPALRHRRRLHESAALWRVRYLIGDDAEGQKELAGGVSGVGADILAHRSHHVTGGVLNELVVAAPDHLTHADVLAAAGAGGGRDERAWPATALAVADGQTKALALALKVAEDPDQHNWRSPNCWTPTRSQIPSIPPPTTPDPRKAPRPATGRC